MSSDVHEGKVFVEGAGRRVLFLERHQGISLDFNYLDAQSGSHFDVRSLPKQFVTDKLMDDVVEGVRSAHKNVILAALGADFDIGKHVRKLRTEGSKGWLDRRSNAATTTATAKKKRSRPHP